MIEFFIPIEPVAQGRPKTRAFMPKSGGNRPIVTVYDPGKSRDYKKQISDQVKKMKLTPFDKDLPLALTVRFLITKPKSVKRAMPTVKPDLDNLIKAVKDALKGLAWHDDSQVCDSTESKRYTESEAGLWVGVREIKL